MALRMAGLLQREGFEVEVTGLGVWGLVGEELEDGGVRAAALGTRSPWDPRAVGRLLALLRRDRIQIVHSLSRRGAFVARALGRVAEVPVVVTSLDGGDLSATWRRRLLERLGAPLADAVVVPSEMVRRQALTGFGLRPGQVRMLRTGVAGAAPEEGKAPRESTRRELGAGPHDLLVGAVGTLREPQKGLSVFLTAARLLSHEISRVRFVVAGDGPDRRRLEARAAEEGVSHRTTFIGRRRDVEAVMQALDLFVQPALRSQSSLPVLEAMAAGTPVVATRTGELPELIADGVNGLLVPPGDAPGLAQACAALLRDRDRAGRLAEAARRRAGEAHRLDRMVEGLAELYRDLMRPAGERTVPQSTAGGRPA